MNTRYKIRCLVYNIRKRIHIRGHDLNCWIQQNRIRKATDKFKRDHPHYCRKCNGWGGGMDHGGYWTPPDMWECPHCVEYGICPHCGDDLNMEHPENDIQCPACGWNFENTDGLPDPDPCDCYLHNIEDLD